MKQKVRSFYAVLIAAMMASCNSGGNIPEIKLIPVKNGSEFEYIDQEGKIIINPQFSRAAMFRDGLALVKSSGENEKWGFISEDGKFAISPNYKDASCFSEGLAWVVAENGAPTAIDSKGQVKITLQDAQNVKIFSEGLAAFSVADNAGQKWGFVNKEGKVKINPQFSDAELFHDGKCPVQNNEGKWGYINPEGKLVINYQFDQAKAFANGKAVVYSGHKAGLIDESGKYVINPQFSDMMNDGDLFLIQQEGKWGWCDKEGKITINPQFSAAFPFQGKELAAVKSGKSYGYIDKAGKIVINPQFDLALPFNGKLALISNNSKVGFIDKDGKYAVNPQFDDVASDLIACMLHGKTEFESVETDYFNVDAIVKAVNVNAPEGQSLNSPIANVLTRFQKSESDLNQYGPEHTLITNQKVTNDASYSFSVVAKPFTEEPDGWYTKKVFNPDAKVGGFVYNINLSGRGFGKAKNLREALEKSFVGYQKSGASTGQMAIFENDKQNIKVMADGGSSVYVEVLSKDYLASQRSEQGFE